MQLWLKQIEEREHLISSAKVPSEQEIRDELKRKGAERKEIKNERLKSWEEKAQQEETFRINLSEGLSKMHEFLQQNQEQEKTLLALMREDMEMKKVYLQEK